MGVATGSRRPDDGGNLDVFCRTLSACLIALYANAALAESSDGATDSPFYIGLGGGVSFLEPETDSVALSLEEDRDIGYKLFGGYRFDSNLGIEIFWADLGTAELGSSSGSTSSVDYSAYGIGAVYQYPLNQHWSLIGKAGLGRLDNDADGVDIDVVNENFVFIGVGANWNFASSWDLRAEYEYFDSDTQFLSLNLVRRFGAGSNRRVDELERQIAEQERELAELAAVVAATGTAKSAPVTPPVAQIACIEGPIELQGVDFAYRSVELSEASMRALDTVIARIRTLPRDVRIEVRAHTDDIGTETYNYVLSLSRARNVRDYMVQQGISLERIDAEGYGELHPLVSNATEAGRERNRRAELVLLGLDKYTAGRGDCALPGTQGGQ